MQRERVQKKTGGASSKLEAKVENEHRLKKKNDNKLIAERENKLNIPTKFTTKNLFDSFFPDIV